MRALPAGLLSLKTTLSSVNVRAQAEGFVFNLKRILKTLKTRCHFFCGRSQRATICWLTGPIRCGETRAPGPVSVLVGV